MREEIGDKGSEERGDIREERRWRKRKMEGAI
jgi:hypothetical protein